MSTESPITVEDFVKTHRNQAIEIISPCGYVSIRPETDLNNLQSHARALDTNMSITWDDVKDHVIMPGDYNFNKEIDSWYALSQCVPKSNIELNNEEQGMRMSI